MFFGVLCENEICLARYEVGDVGFSLIEEGVRFDRNQVLWWG